MTEVGVDETSSKRGHNYVSVFVDMETPKVLFATEGKDASTLERFKTDLEAHQGDPSHIQEVCCDKPPPPAFISGVEKPFPEAQLTFDKFHVLKIINEAVDEVRRQEQQSRPELLRSYEYRYIGATQDVHNYLITTKKSDIAKIYRYSVFFKAKYEIARFFLPRSGLLEQTVAPKPLIIPKRKRAEKWFRFSRLCIVLRESMLL